jgi:hypothetical protein
MLPALIEISQLPEINSKLSAIDRDIVRPNEAIKDMSNINVARTLNVLVDNIAKDVGIKEVEEHYRKRFITLIVKYYGDMTIADIKLAFELSIVGELDDFLPRQNGQVDKGHYSRFSPEYTMKILSAYKKRKNNTKLKIHALTPKYEKVFSEDEKKKMKQVLHNMIVDSLNIYADKNIEPSFYKPELVLTEFKEKKVTRTIPVPDIDYSNHFYKVIHSNVTDDTKKRLISERKDKHISEFLKVSANADFYNAKILEVFKYILTTNKSLEDYGIKKNNIEVDKNEE